MEKAHNSYRILVRQRKARKSCLWKTVEQFMSLPIMYILCSNFFQVSSSSSSKNFVNNFFQLLELASKIKPQERPFSFPSETWRKKSLCASSCRFWKRLTSFDSTKQAAILKLNHMVLDCIISFTIQGR